MSFAIMGSGGLGGFFGALLATTGEDVAFLARGAHLAAIRQNGLRVESARGDMHIHPATATDDPASVGPVDCVLFTVKLWDTETAAAACRPMLGADTAVLTLQNGIDSMARLAAVLGQNHVLGGVTYVPSVIAGPGVIRHTGSAANLIFGEPGGRRSARAERLLAVFQRAGIEAEISPDIGRTIWEKFVFLVASSGVTSFTGLRYGPLRADPEAREMFRQVMAEAAAVAGAEGIPVGDDFIDGRMAFLDQAPPDMTSSMAQDRSRGNRLELDWFAGTVVRLGAAHGIATPVNAAIYNALN